MSTLTEAEEFRKELEEITGNSFKYTITELYGEYWTSDSIFCVKRFSKNGGFVLNVTLPNVEMNLYGLSKNAVISSIQIRIKEIATKTLKQKG